MQRCMCKGGWTALWQPLSYPTSLFLMYHCDQASTLATAGMKDCWFCRTGCFLTCRRQENETQSSLIPRPLHAPGNGTWGRSGNEANILYWNVSVCVCCCPTHLVIQITSWRHCHDIDITIKMQPSHGLTLSVWCSPPLSCW